MRYCNPSPGLGSMELYQLIHPNFFTLPRKFAPQTSIKHIKYTFNFLPAYSRLSSPNIPSNLFFNYSIDLHYIS